MRQLLGPDVFRSGGGLPTEAEWEFAAKSRDSNRAYPLGNVPPVLRNVAKANINNPFNTPASPPLPWCGTSRPTGPSRHL